MKKEILLRKNEITQWIKEKKPKNFICKELNCRPSTLDSWLKKMNIEYNGKQNWAKGKKFPERLKPAINYLRNDFSVSSDKLKKRLFRDGIKEKKCEICGRTKWNNLEISLELHHKDGNRHNNELSNIQILCPNCHSQTSNFNKPLKCKSKIREIKHCECGKEINKRAKRCPSCDKINQRKVKDRPTKEELILMVKDTSLEAVGRKYNVSGNTVKKWIKNEKENCY